MIVVISEAELPALETIYQRGRTNGVCCEMMNSEQLHELEPQEAGIKAVHVPEAGIVDYGQVCKRFAKHLQNNEDNQIHCSTKVIGIRHSENIVVESEQGEFEGRFLVNCAGL